MTYARSRARVWTAAVVAVLWLGLVLPSPSAAQAPQADWTQGTTLNLLGGVSFDSDTRGPGAGGGFGWEINRRLSIEANGAWFDRGDEAESFAADLTALLALVPPRGLMPFVKGGVGLYRASFNPSVSPMPAFYRERLTLNTMFGQHAAFTDPTIVAGGGVVLWVNEHISLRPEADVKLVIDDSKTYTVTTVGVRLAWHFEDHPRESRGR